MTSARSLCRVLNISRSTYYKHFRKKPAPRISENQRIKSMILHIYADYDKRLGAYMVQYILQCNYGIDISVGRVYRLMRSMELPQMSTEKPKPGCHRTDNGECAYHLQQQFSQDAPNLVWVSDITYLKAGGKWYYLCVVIDLFSRKVISWHLSGKADASLVMTTFQKAYENRNAPYGLMFHSDRGTQYTVFSFRQLLDSLNVVQSFSKKGYPFDNAVCECFFKYLKREETSRRTYHTFNELHLSVFEYIEGFYNSRRPLGPLGYLTPNEM